MDQGKLPKWLVRPGDRVQKGQVIAVVDTPKATIDVERWHDGVVRTLLVELADVDAFAAEMNRAARRPIAPA